MSVKIFVLTDLSHTVRMSKPRTQIHFDFSVSNPLSHSFENLINVSEMNLVLLPDLRNCVRTVLCLLISLKFLVFVFIYTFGFSYYHESVSRSITISFVFDLLRFIRLLVLWSSTLSHCVWRIVKGKEMDQETKKTLTVKKDVFCRRGERLIKVLDKPPTHPVHSLIL